MIQFQQIIYFLKIAELRSINKAAAKLYVSQPSLSQSIKNLEDELNRFEGYSSDAHRYLWDAFESYPSSRNFFDQLQEGFLHESRKISNSYLEELDELAIQKRKVEDDLNDIYHERKKLMIEKECDDGN